VIKESDHVKNLKNTLDSYETFIGIKEPRSNRGLEQFKTQAQMDIEKAEEKAKAEKAIKES
jgi:hypothetical protein